MEDCIVTKLKEQVNASGLPVFHPVVELYNDEQHALRAGVINKSAFSEEVSAGDMLVIDVGFGEYTGCTLYSYLNDNTYTQVLSEVTGNKTIEFSVPENFKEFKTWTSDQSATAGTKIPIAIYLASD